MRTLLSQTILPDKQHQLMRNQNDCSSFDKVNMQLKQDGRYMQHKKPVTSQAVHFCVRDAYVIWHVYMYIIWHVILFDKKVCDPLNWIILSPKTQTTNKTQNKLNSFQYLSWIFVLMKYQGHAPRFLIVQYYFQSFFQFSFQVYFNICFVYLVKSKKFFPLNR